MALTSAKSRGAAAATSCICSTTVETTPTIEAKASLSVKKASTATSLAALNMAGENPP